MSKIYIPLISFEDNLKIEKYNKYIFFAFSSIFITYKLGYLDNFFDYLIIKKKKYTPCKNRFMKWLSIENETDEDICIEEEFKNFIN